MDEQPHVDADTTLLADAKAAGFATSTDAETIADPAAARLLPIDVTDAVGIKVARNVLLVHTDTIPTPARLRELEKTSGMSVAVTVVPTSIFTQVRERASAAGIDGAPRAVGPALVEAINAGASDVHLSVGSPPILRVTGGLRPLPQWPNLSVADLDHTVTWITGRSAADLPNDVDCAFDYAGARWRVSLYRQRGALAAALRRLPARVPDLESLSVPAAVTRLPDLTQGLVLFCGPTGHGKSTTQAALLDRINASRDCHILTIEDPIEYVHTSRRATVHQREVGQDTATFATGLRHALRQDPDVLLVGEMRDTETMATAISAAETGHLVLATVHAMSAAGVFSRVIDAFPAEQQPQIRTQLASSLQAVVAQLLLPSTEPGKRQLVCEVLIATPAVRNLVREGKLHELASTMESGAKDGMTTMDRSLAAYVAAGRIAEDLAINYASSKEVFKDLLARETEKQSSSGRLAGLDSLNFGVQ